MGVYLCYDKSVDRSINGFPIFFALPEKELEWVRFFLHRPEMAEKVALGEKTNGKEKAEAGQ